MRYAVIAFLETRESPRHIRNEIVSTLEFDYRTTVESLVVLTKTGDTVAVYDRKEQTHDSQVHGQRQRKPARKTRRR